MFPGSLLPSTYADPENPDRLLARSELERRRDYIQPLHSQLGEQHPLVQLVHQCLSNNPARRPSTEELLQRLEAVRAQIGRSHGSYNFKVELTKLQLAMMSVVETEMGEKDREIEYLQQELHQLQVALACRRASRSAILCFNVVEAVCINFKGRGIIAKPIYKSR